VGKVETESVVVQLVEHQVVGHMEHLQLELLFQDKAILEDMVEQDLNSLVEAEVEKDLLEVLELVMAMDQEVQEVPFQQEVRQ
jgi:hypothetical protein|tara:strand:+ start:323 stop:571 length:249 start_codon:yes stop_codon:yes gene_type:complete